MTSEERLQHWINVFWEEVPWAMITGKDAHRATVLLAPWASPGWESRVIAKGSGEHAIEFFRRTHIEGRHYQDELIFFCHDWDSVKINQKQFELHLRQCLKAFAELPREE